MIGRGGVQSDGRKCIGGRSDVQANDAYPISKSIVLGIIAGERGQSRIELDERHIKPGDAVRERKPGSTDAGAKLDRALAAMRGDCGGQQDRIMAEAMAAPRLTQHEPAAE